MTVEEIIEEYKKSHPDITDLFYDDDIIMCRVQILMEFSDEVVRWTIPLEVCPANFDRDQINRLFDTMYDYYHENGTCKGYSYKYDESLAEDTLQEDNNASENL